MVTPRLLCVVLAVDVDILGWPYESVRGGLTAVALLLDGKGEIRVGRRGMRSLSAAARCSGYEYTPTPQNPCSAGWCRGWVVVVVAIKHGLGVSYIHTPAALDSTSIPVSVFISCFVRHGVQSPAKDLV